MARTGKYTHGKSSGTSDRQSSRRTSAVPGETGGVIKDFRLSGPGESQKIRTNTQDYFRSQPLSVPSAIQIPNAPERPDDSQNLRNLANAFGEVNTRLQSFLGEIPNYEKSLDSIARERAEIKALTEDSNVQINKAKGALESKAKTDPEAANSYGLFASMDQRVEREYAIVKAKNQAREKITNFENLANEAYQASFSDETRADELGDIIPLNPSTPEWTKWATDQFKDINPQARLELANEINAAIYNARRTISKQHADYKDTKAEQTFIINIGDTLLDSKNASLGKISGGTDIAGRDDDDPNFTGLSFTFTDDITHARNNSGMSIKKYQELSEPTKLLSTIATAVGNNANDSSEINDLSDRALTMLLKTRVGAGNGQLLSEAMGGEHILKRTWENAISQIVLESARVNDAAAIETASQAGDTFAINIIQRSKDADFDTENITEAFGDHQVYTINGKPYKVTASKNSHNLQGMVEAIENEKREAYKKFSTLQEINAYTKSLDDNLEDWIEDVGIAEQNENEKYLRERINTSDNPIETEALINEFANKKWINSTQKNFLLQNNTLQETLKQRRDDYNETMEQPIVNVEGRLKTLYSARFDGDLEPENWDAKTQREYRERIYQFQTDANKIFGALNEDTYGERIEKIKDLEIKLLGKIDDEIAGKPTTTQQQSTTTETTQEKTEEETPSSITTAAYNQLDSNEQKLYEPVTNNRGRTVAYTPVESEDYEYKGKGIRDYLEAQGLKKLFGFERGRGDDRANQDLKAEVQTTPIYDQSILEQQINRLEELAEEFPNGIDWEALSKESGYALRSRTDLDYKALNVLLERTDLTPKEFFESQINAHGLPMPPGLLDKLFPDPESNISLEEFQRLPSRQQNQYESDGRNRFKLKKNNDQAFNIENLPGQEIAQVASTDLSWMPAQKVNPKKDLETEMLNVIHKGESTVDTKGGGYEAFNQGGAEEGKKVLGFSGTYGDHPANKGKKLTEMTIQEILDIQDSGYNTDLYPFTKEGTKKWHDSGGIHAAGRYQFIRVGLREALKRSGIKPTEKFTPEIQDKLALTLLLEIGPNQWTSMKGNKQLQKLLDKYNKTDWTKSSTIDGRSDIA